MRVTPSGAALRRAASFLTLAGFAILAGCSGSGVRVHPVRGEVFVGGKPAEGAVVHLHPFKKDKNEPCPPAYATVQSNGSFQLTTYRPNDGAAVGEYVVTVAWRPERTVEGETIVGPDRLRDRYSKQDKSTLKATVTAGDNVLPRFDLK